MKISNVPATALWSFLKSPFSNIGALIGTSQLGIEDWVLECVEEVPDPHSKLYYYIHDPGFWNEDPYLYKAFCDPD